MTSIRATTVQPPKKTLPKKESVPSSSTTTTIQEAPTSISTPMSCLQSQKRSRQRNKDFIVQKIRQEINYAILKTAFQKNAQRIESFIKKNLHRMVLGLISSNKTQQENILDNNNTSICTLKVRWYRGKIQILAKTWLGSGGFKTVQKVAHLFGPFLPNQPGPLYAYAKNERRTALRHEFKEIQQKIVDATASNASATQIVELKQELSKLQGKINTLQNEFLEEAAISKKFPTSDVVRMWVVTNQKDQFGIKGVMMELCDKGSLWNFVDTLTYPLSQENVQNNIRIASRIAQTLADIHDKGKMCHLDVKLGNILLSSKCGQLTPKLTDFGLSKRSGVDLQYPCGTPSYMAPELYNTTKSAQPSMDAWSLGIILTEMFYGLSANPFYFDPEVQSAARDFFNSNRYQTYKAIWERIGKEIKNSLHQYPLIDKIIRHLLDLNPITRWTTKMAAEALRIAYNLCSS